MFIVHRRTPKYDFNIMMHKIYQLKSITIIRGEGNKPKNIIKHVYDNATAIYETEHIM